MENDQTIKSLATLRVAIGASAWATPRLAGKAFGLDAAGNPQSPYLARLFGIRDIAVFEELDGHFGYEAGNPRSQTVRRTTHRGPDDGGPLDVWIYDPRDPAN